MTTRRLTHTMRYVSAAGDGEARWIRLDQETADESVTVAEAAEILDVLYDIDACGQGISGGGEEAAAETPDESRFDSAVAVLMGAETCAESEYWTAHVRVYRSHQSPEYVLRSASAEIVSVEAGLTDSVREVIENAGNSHDLEYSYAGDLVLPPGVRGEVRGSTLNLSRPAGRLVVRYTTTYDRVTLRVPVTAASSARGEEEQARRAALDAAGLVALQGRGPTAVAAAVALEPPEQDDSLSAAELARLCRARYQFPEREGECWQTVRHHSKCVCSGRDAPGDWEERVSAPCPEGVRAGSHVGTSDVLDGYVWCAGEEDPDLPDREFYKRVCCEYPPQGKQLPLCRTYYETWRGGEPVEGSAAAWQALYGEDVRFVAVSPPGGVCGEKITEWEVNRPNCCDDITPMSPDPGNPTSIHAGERVFVGVLDGRHPGLYRWRASGGLYFDATGTPEATTTGPGKLLVRTRDAVCPQPRVEVDDGCQPVTMTFEGGAATPVELSQQDVVAYPNQQFTLSVSGGVPPYMWSVGAGITYELNETGTVAFCETGGPEDWCVVDITVSDQCGQGDTCTVRNAETGRWTFAGSNETYGCTPPGSPFKSTYPCILNNSANSYPNKGYYINYQAGCTSSSLSCDDAKKSTRPGRCVDLASLFVGYADAIRNCCNGPSWAECHVAGECNVMRHRYEDHRILEYRYCTGSYNLYRWLC